MLPDGSPGHACGHNLIGAAALGTGYVISRLLLEYGLEGGVNVFDCSCDNDQGTIHLKAED
ncbi:MAG: hypothetical protein ACLFVP_05275 [Candidatus Bathyarchaeia archaeon]